MLTERPSISTRLRAQYREIDYTHHCGVSYPDKSLAQDIKRLHRLWRQVQSDRQRDAIYGFLTGVYDLIECWQVEHQVAQRLKRALAIAGMAAIEQHEPFSAILQAAIAPDRLERRKLSKYARALRFAASCKRPGTRLDRFIKGHGGLNGSASAFAKQRRRSCQRG
jgi:hypothetical protein